jgi:hypothetical protein
LHAADSGEESSALGIALESMCASDVGSTDNVSTVAAASAAVEAPPQLGSEASHCELRDALTLAVQQRDSAVHELHAVAERSAAAVPEAEALRTERDSAMDQVFGIRKELSQCDQRYQEREREHHEASSTACTCV